MSLLPSIFTFVPMLVMLGLGLLSQLEPKGAWWAPNSPLEKELAALARLPLLRFKTKPGSANAGAFRNWKCSYLIYDANPRLLERAYYRWILRHEIGHLKNCDTSKIWLEAVLVSLACAVGCRFLETGELVAAGLALIGAFVGWRDASRRAERQADVFATEHTPPEELSEIAETFLSYDAKYLPPGMWRRLGDCHPTMRERATLLLDKRRALDRAQSQA